MTCYLINYFPSENLDPGDSTDAISIAVRSATILVFVTLVLICVSGVMFFTSFTRYRRSSIIFISGIIFIVAGLMILAGLIDYIAKITGEVGNKLKPKSTFDIPQFRYSYGWSFMLASSSFVFTELAGLMAVLLFINMFKRSMLREDLRRVMSTSTTNVPSELQRLNHEQPMGRENHTNYIPHCNPGLDVDTGNDIKMAGNRLSPTLRNVSPALDRKAAEAAGSSAFYSTRFPHEVHLKLPRSPTPGSYIRRHHQGGWRRTSAEQLEHMASSPRSYWHHHMRPLPDTDKVSMEMCNKQHVPWPSSARPGQDEPPPPSYHEYVHNVHCYTGAGPSRLTLSPLPPLAASHIMLSPRKSRGRERSREHSRSSSTSMSDGREGEDVPSPLENFLQHHHPYQHHRTGQKQKEKHCPQTSTGRHSTHHQQNHCARAQDLNPEGSVSGDLRRSRPAQLTKQRSLDSMRKTTPV